MRLFLGYILLITGFETVKQCNWYPKDFRTDIIIAPTTAKSRINKSIGSRTGGGVCKIKNNKLRHIALLTNNHFSNPSKCQLAGSSPLYLYSF